MFSLFFSRDQFEIWNQHKCRTTPLLGSLIVTVSGLLGCSDNKLWTLCGLKLLFKSLFETGRSGSDKNSKKWTGHPVCWPESPSRDWNWTLRGTVGKKTQSKSSGNLSRSVQSKKPLSLPRNSFSAFHPLNSTLNFKVSKFFACSFWKFCFLFFRN